MRVSTLMGWTPCWSRAHANVAAVDENPHSAPLETLLARCASTKMTECARQGYVGLDATRMGNQQRLKDDEPNPLGGS